MPDLSAIAIGSWFSYLIAALVPGGDAVLPFLPGETVMITIGVVAASTHDPRTIVLFLLGVTSAWGGDNLSYLLGRRFGHRIIDRYFHGERGAKAVQWADRALSERAATLLILARFIPGGRTALTLVAGSRDYPWARFRVYTAIAAVLWGIYSTGLGYLGGRRFEHNSLLALGVALATGLTVTALIEAGRSFLRRRGGRRQEPREPGNAPGSEPAGNRPHSDGSGQEIAPDRAGDRR
jgi:membrane-associated protein